MAGKILERDIILRVNGIRVSSQADYNREIAKIKKEDTGLFWIKRKKLIFLFNSN